MLITTLRDSIRLLLTLRYRIQLRGLDAITHRGTRGILFLPNHPALIDPIILMTSLHARFAPRALADEDQIARPVVRPLAELAGIIPIPDIKQHGSAVRTKIQQATDAAAQTLQTGGNVLLYPSGHIYRTRHEDLRGNSGAHDLVRRVPDARVVLVRTRGLWGSGFSMARGAFPDLPHFIQQRCRDLLGNLFLFTPRRHVTIDFAEPPDLPRDDRAAFNAQLERYYNDAAPPAVHVAYRWNERPRVVTLPDPQWGLATDDIEHVPPSTREKICAHLRSASGVEHVTPRMSLSRDLGLDSLARTELLVWLEREFGATTQDGEAIHTVADVMLLAHGEAVVRRPTALPGPPPGWRAPRTSAPLSPTIDDTIPAAFLRAARRGPDDFIVADAVSGARRYRDLILAILALRPLVQRLPGEYIGVMMPASVGADVLYLTALFAGKTPVMINWTTGPRSLAHTLDTVGVRRVLTSAALLTRLRAQGVDFGPLAERMTPVEELRGQIGPLRKLRAWLCSRFNWRSLDGATIRKTAVVLVTSGSEALPKSVPLTHANILNNIRDLLRIVDLRADDCMLGFLPPFHSFGLTAGVVTPLVARVSVIHHANPNEGMALATLCAKYGATIALGTPTFLSGIVRAAPRAGVLASLRLIVTGAEKCPPRTYAAFARACPDATVLEGYGITECSPVVAVNRPERPIPETIGKVLPSFVYAIVDPEQGGVVERGRRGMLLVRGPSVFDGYLDADAPSPFVEHDGQTWYRTGDLVTEDADGVLTFQGRLKRFVKVGGEMVALPAIEAAIADEPGTPDDGPPVAVVAVESPSGRPELVLFTTRGDTRTDANERIRGAGLSPLHHIHRVVEIEEIPLLGNGKIDYRRLQSLAESS